MMSIVDPPVIIKANIGVLSPVLVSDLGYSIPIQPAFVTLDEVDSIEEAQNSSRLEALLTDDSFGAGSSTLIINDGTRDLDQEAGLLYLRRADIEPTDAIDPIPIGRLMITIEGGIIYDNDGEFLLKEGP